MFQLSEVLAFSATDNVALHKPVSASSSTRGYGWAEKYLVDGFMPYLMDAARGAQSVAFITTTNLWENADLTVDLEESLPISRIHLHAVDQTDTVPQAFAGDVGIPKWLRIEGANAPDFSDAKVLADIRHQTIYAVGPIMMHSFPETKCRYVQGSKGSASLAEPAAAAAGLRARLVRQALPASWAAGVAWTDVPRLGELHHQVHAARR